MLSIVVDADTVGDDDDDDGDVFVVGESLGNKFFMETEMCFCDKLLQILRINMSCFWKFNGVCNKNFKNSIKKLYFHVNKKLYLHHTLSSITNQLQF